MVGNEPGPSQQQMAPHCLSVPLLSGSAKGRVRPQPVLLSPNKGSLNAHYMLEKHQDTVRPRNVVTVQ